VGFVLELSLGHGTHAANLGRLLPAMTIIDADIREIGNVPSDLGARIPVYRDNWTIRSGMQALRSIASMRRAGRLDGLFIHTQVPAVLSQPWMLRIPTIVSLDATPLQIDEFGAAYHHVKGTAFAEKLRYKANRSCFHRAAHVVAWSNWAKDGVVHGYGVDPDKVSVVPPGVIPELWHQPERSPESSGPVQILFVGADFVRKGGDLLVRAFADLRATLTERDGVPLADLPELHLVTSAEIAPEPGVHVHRGLAPNSPELVAQYRNADIFCLPTRADCLGLVLAEAGASGLPLLATDVGGISEIVRDDETGLLVAPTDVAALRRALERLVVDPDLRWRLGQAALRRVTERHDAERNADTLARLVVEQIERHERRSTR
jgi:glycosyltransferase involved in cell wall biosynthesis